MKADNLIAGITLAWLWCHAPLLAQTPENRNEVSRRAVSAVIADRHVPDTALAVHHRALTLAVADRYLYLADWVLPGKSHASFRLTPDFTPTHPAPPATENDPVDAMRIQLAKQRGEKRVQIGGNLISPALDLIAVANELGRIPELRKRVEATASPNESPQEKRARFSLLSLLDMAIQDFDAALRDLDALFPLMESNHEHTLSGRAPELLAIYGAHAHPQTRAFARDAAAHLYVKGIRISGRGPLAAWESHLLAIMATIRRLDRQPGESNDVIKSAVEMSLEPRLTEWSQSSRTVAASRGPGYSRSHWQRVDQRIENDNSHKDDFLYYRIPLQGNFQVECDLQNKDYQNTQIVVGGQWAEPLYYSRTKYEFGDLRQRLTRADIQPTLTKYNDWAHLRVTVNGQLITYYVNGRLVHRVEVQGDVDPWIALRSEDRHDGGAKDIRISGEPVIPREVRLTASEELTGWFPYFPGQIGKPKATWQQLGDIPNGGGFIAPRRTDLAGMNVERLLRYHRPMFEDGTIAYDFFYRAGTAHVHPALDRLVFLLEPNGVRLHWVTDGEFDRTELSADNVFDEPAQRRGPQQLPLIENDWNRLRLTLEGDSIALFLNEQLIYQREIEITNQRSFGLFHYSDRTEARVRNVRWRGAWPHELPPVARQELTSDAIQMLDDKLPELTAVVQHNFAEDGLPPEKLTVTSSKGDFFQPTSGGIRVNRPGGPGYYGTTVALNMTVAGDFDVTAGFREFDAQPGADAISTAGIKLLMSEVNPQQCLVMRRFVRESKAEDKQLAQAVLRSGATEATLDWRTLYSDAQESDSGRLRIARRGSRIYYLVADADSPNFRLLAESEAASGSLPFKGVQLLTQSSGEGRMSVVWKDIVVRAESLTLLPPANTLTDRTMSVMNHDGTNVRRLLPRDAGLDGPGSPAWSHDGKLVAFDVFNGSTSNSRIHLVNSDGTNVRDLGIGNMPTFSPDNKRIAFSWGGNRIAIMNVDGTNREVLDSNGWGAQWSPDGRIAYARGGNVVIHDPRTKMQREILEGEQSSRYANVYWNLGWSRDGQRVCFKARTSRDNQYEIAVAAAAGSIQEFQVLYTSPRETYTDFSWHPDGNRILFSMSSGGGPRLFTLDRRKPGNPELLAGQPLNHYISGADWSDDGQLIVFSSQVLPDQKSGQKPKTNP